MAFLDFSRTERIDLILSWFAISGNAKPYASIADVLQFLNELDKGIHTNWLGNLKVIIDRIINKLEEDGFVRSNITIDGEGNHVNIYSVTENGIEFYNGGGYANQNQQKIDESAEKQRQIRREIGIYNLTSILAIGTAIAAVYYIMQMLKDVNIPVINLLIIVVFFYAAGILTSYLVGKYDKTKK